MLPHLTNSQAGINKYDPAHSNIYEVYFTLPEPLRASFAKDEMLITEHVLKISGIGAIHQAPGVGQQKFMGTDRSFINPKMDSTHAELSIDLTLNLRNGTDNYIYKLFKAWSRLGYNVSTGERMLKKDYCADWLKVSIGNRAGDIYHEIVFKDVMMNGGLDGFDELNYDTADPITLTVKFVSDWWTESEV